MTETPSGEQPSGEQQPFAPWFVIHNSGETISTQVFIGEGAEEAARLFAQDRAANWSEVYICQGVAVSSGDFEAPAHRACKLCGDEDLLDLNQTTGLCRGCEREALADAQPHWLRRWIESATQPSPALVIAFHFSIGVVYGGLGNYRASPENGDEMVGCTMLLNKARQNGLRWRDRMSELAVYPEWAPIVSRWGEIEKACLDYEADECKHRIHMRSLRPKDWHAFYTPAPSLGLYLLSWLKHHIDPYAGRKVPWERLP